MKKLNLAGIWRMYLGQFSPDTVPNDEICLPSTLSMERKTPYHIEDTAYHLADPYAYTGSAVFVRDVQLDSLSDRIFLTLERTRITRVFVDGILAGEDDTLCGVQRFDLTEYVKKPTFSLAVEVSNDHYQSSLCHMTSPDTQTNWLGILGEMTLNLYDGLRIHTLRVTGDVDNKTARISFRLDASEKGMAKITFRTACGEYAPAETNPCRTGSLPKDIASSRNSATILLSSCSPSETSCAATAR